MEFDLLKKEVENEILPLLKYMGSKDRNDWRSKIRFSKNESDLNYIVEKLNEKVMIGDVVELVLIKNKKYEKEESKPNLISTKTLLESDIEPISWLVEGLIPKAGVVVYGGDSGSLKSFGALHIGICLASGQKVFDKFETKK
ncbi:AAA family ATPase, partial [Candidatus Woesearchaeota archaeon]|nr:AAA family ATPase [Candidatus Woesearchaeota archaeon]